MLRSVAAASLILCLSAPAFADPAAPKAKKICKAVNNGNPLFPTYRCTTVPAETAAAPAPAAQPVAAADPAPAATSAPTQVAQNASAPH